MAKWKVKLIYKDVVEVEVEADDKESAINMAVECQDAEGVHTDYFWHDAEAEQS